MFQKVIFILLVLSCCAALPTDVLRQQPAALIIHTQLPIERSENAEILQTAPSGWRKQGLGYGGRFGQGSGWRNGYGSYGGGYGSGYTLGWKRGGAGYLWG